MQASSQHGHKPRARKEWQTWELREEKSCGLLSSRHWYLADTEQYVLCKAKGAENSVLINVWLDILEDVQNEKIGHETCHVVSFNAANSKYTKAYSQHDTFVDF